MRPLLLLFPIALVAVVGCKPRESESKPTPVITTVAPTPSASTSTRAKRSQIHEGSTIARTPDDRALLVANEDIHALFRVALPFDPALKPTSTPLPGAPAQVLALADKVLVTIRDPGLLLVMTPSQNGELAETARVSLPADAWGLAVSPDERTAFVSSAWTHQISAVDLGTSKIKWSTDVAREPRGIVVSADGSHLYVSHLTTRALTRVDALDGTPISRALDLPTAPSLTVAGTASEGSLGWSLALSPDGSRLFAPRHALGAVGAGWWWGVGAVDVLSTKDDTPLAPKRLGSPMVSQSKLDSAPISERGASLIGAGGPIPTSLPLVQPRAIAYRSSTDTILVAAEGTNLLVELDALLLEPGVKPLATYQVGDKVDAMTPTSSVGGAPSGVVLSADEKTAYVACRSTFDVVAVSLVAPFETVDPKAKPLAVRLADDPASKTAQVGRRLFYDANNSIVSGGLGCSGCHPDGRDDGHTWHEGVTDKGAGFAAMPQNLDTEDDKDSITRAGFARQTPMLAGRLQSAGPFGWHAQSKNLADRVLEGFQLHRTFGGFAFVNGAYQFESDGRNRHHAQCLIDFVTTGLVPPPRENRPLTAIEEQGKTIFNAKQTACATCHVPARGYSDRAVSPMPERAGPSFASDPDKTFRTPSLLFVGGTAPYFHDASATTLEELVEKNANRMGMTSQLSPEDRTALVAFLRTL